MKKQQKFTKLNFKSLLLFLAVSIITTSSFAQCLFTDTTSNYNPNRSTNAMYGWRLPPNGEIKILVVFAEVLVNGQAVNTANWPAGQFPLWANNLLSTNITGMPSEYFSKMFYESSLGNLKITGDYLINPNNPNAVIQVNSTGGSVFTQINNYINTNYPYFLTKNSQSFGSFDKWQINTKANWEPAVNTSNGMAEHIMYIIKGTGLNNDDNTGAAGTNNITLFFNNNATSYTFETNSDFVSYNNPPLAIARHALSKGNFDTHLQMYANDYSQ